MDYKQSFVLYESVYSQFERLVKAGKIDGANCYIDAVMQYGLFGVVPDDNDEVWLYGLDNVIASINSAKSNYRKKINVPKEELARYLQEGRTQQEIADIFNCSVDTIQRRIKEYGLNSLPPKEYFFDDDTATDCKETGRNYHSHSLLPSDSISHKDSQKSEEVKQKYTAENLGF